MERYGVYRDRDESIYFLIDGRRVEGKVFNEWAESAGDQLAVTKKRPAALAEGAHTPGPWEVREYDGTMKWWDIPGVAHVESSEANARLIMSAPDLLEACESALDALPSHSEDCGCDGCEAKLTLGGAIAKAEGKQV